VVPFENAFLITALPPFEHYKCFENSPLKSIVFEEASSPKETFMKEEVDGLTSLDRVF